MSPFRFVLTAALALLIGGPASAQDDWDLIEREAHLSASLVFDSSIAVAVRCDDGELETYIAGLPLTRERDNRITLRYALGDRPLRESSWQTSRDARALFADLPAPLARRFREGGDLQLQVPARRETPARRYVVSLPPSPAAIDRVLAACDRPAVDPRDALRTDETSIDPDAVSTRTLRWVQQPRPNYPPEALTRGASGMAVLSCLPQAEGALTECQIEVERPSGFGFGESALRAARNARIGVVESDQSVGGGVATFTVNFRMP